MSTNTQKNRNHPDTIAAIATPSGAGGIGIVRVSGNDAIKIANNITHKNPEPRKAIFTGFYRSDDTLIDEGLVIYFQAPHSFTGEDVVEFQGHGGVVVMDRLLKEVILAGARMAKPGEFSERAFLNDQIDLIQAEAIADLISSRTELAANAAARTLTGEFSKAITELQEKITHFRMYIEAALDFPEEEIDFLSNTNLVRQYQEVVSQFELLQRKAKQGVLLQEGLRVVILGRPNAGKSTLLNYLAGKDVAIVTDIAGTTRDVMREQIQIKGVPLQIVDTAGIRETECPIEQEGISRAKREMESADHVLVLVDCQTLGDVTILMNEVQTDKMNARMLILANKIDQSIPTDLPKALHGIPVIPISAKTGEGISLLADHLIGQSDGEIVEGEFLARRRHLTALEGAHNALLRANEFLKSKQGELLAEECRIAQKHLSEITGSFTSDDLLGEIFSRFCIGK